MSDLKGKTIVFTGTLSMQRKDATAMAEKAGAIVTSAVSGKTNILVAGPGSGSKMDAAKAKGITVWTEMEFVNACSGKAAPAASKAKKAPKKAAASEATAPAPAPKKAAAKKTKKATEAPADEDDGEDDAPPKKVAKKDAGKSPAQSGGRAVDREVPGRGDFKVWEDWAITLNQTNIGGGANNNKYYIIQVLEKDGKFYSWNRWGRVGEPGQNKLEACGSLPGAIALFEKKFTDKTGNKWSSVKGGSFKPKDGKYKLVEMDDKDAGEGDSSAPLGKLSKGQIEKGQAVLAKICQAIESNAGRAKLDELSSEFFTLIPTNVGRQRPPTIAEMNKVHEKEELLKFYLRMGFDEVETKMDRKMTPIEGVMELPVPKTLADSIAHCCPKASIVSSVNQGKKLAAKQAGGPIRKMTEEQYGSIMLYTSNAIYAELNKALREEKRTIVEKYFKYLRLLFDAADCLPKKSVRLWRGITVDLTKQYTEGSIITWWGVSSCTADVNVAKNFMNGCGGDCTLLTIDTETAVDISQVTFYANEKESLLLPGTQLQVISAKKNGKVAEIHLKEVGRAVG